MAHLHIFKKGWSAQRNFYKAISWRFVCAANVVLLAWQISGYFFMGVGIGLCELLINTLLYYPYERLWQSIPSEAPAKSRKGVLKDEKCELVLFRQMGRVSRSDRETLNEQKTFTLWFTGLSGSGKSTLAIETEEWLHRHRHRVYILDGDNTRLGVNSDLSFTEEDRAENIRRVAEMCKLFNDAGVIVIASFISPITKDRDLAKSIIEGQNFIEVFVDAAIDVCRARDSKGLYKLAAAGKIKNFTGISSPYESPLNPQIHLQTGLHSIEACSLVIKKYLFFHRSVCKNDIDNLV